MSMFSGGDRAMARRHPMWAWGSPGSVALLAGLLWRAEVEWHGWAGLTWLDHFHWAVPIGVLLFLGWLALFCGVQPMWKRTAFRSCRSTGSGARPCLPRGSKSKDAAGVCRLARPNALGVQGVYRGPEPPGPASVAVAAVAVGEGEEDGTRWRSIVCRGYNPSRAPAVGLRAGKTENRGRRKRGAVQWRSDCPAAELGGACPGNSG